MPKLQQIESHVHIRCVFSCQVGFIWLERYLPNLTLISSTPFFLRWSSSLQSCPGLDAGPTPASFAGGWWSSLPVWKKNFNSSASTSESSWIIHGEWVPELPSNEAPSTAGGASTYPCILLSQELRNKYCVESKRNWYNAPLLHFSFHAMVPGAASLHFILKAWRRIGVPSTCDTENCATDACASRIVEMVGIWHQYIIIYIYIYIYIYSTSIVHPQKPIKNKGHENMGHENCDNSIPARPPFDTSGNNYSLGQERAGSVYLVIRSRDPLGFEHRGMQNSYSDSILWGASNVVDHHFDLCFSCFMLFCTLVS